MQVQPKVTFRDFESSPALEAKIEERIERLEKMYGLLTSCQVVVESPHRHHHQGRIYHVRLHLAVPGGDIVVGRDPSEHHAHEDVYVAVRDAFDAAERRLEDHARRRRGEVKQHQIAPR